MSLTWGNRRALLSASAEAWSPSSLGGSLLAWWDAEDPTTITESGGLVSSWRDKVAAYDAVQAIGASQPVYSSSSFNGRPGIAFDGTDDELTLGSVPFPVGATPLEIWALVDQLAIGTDPQSRRIFSYGDGTAAASVQLVRAGVSNVSRAANVYGSVSVTNPTVDLSGRHVVRGRMDAAAGITEVDGVTMTSAAAVPAAATTRTRLGASPAGTAGGFWQGRLSAVFVTTPLSAPADAQFLAYLKLRGGIA